jgi:hypothetical protein
MSAVDRQKWYHTNKYAGEVACRVCDGVVRHAYWCPKSNPVVGYAYGVVEDAGLLTFEDQLILHALGVAWV